MKILLLSLDFYDYTKQLIQELSSRGHEVTFFDIRPYRKDEISKYLFKTNPKFRSRALKKYADLIIKRTRNVKFDLIFAISVNTFERDDLKRILDSQPQAKRIYYMWDSLSNFPDMKDHFSLFEKVFSFDCKDCRECNLVFQPMFIGTSVERIAKQENAISGDVSFVAVTHSHRYQISKRFAAFASKNEIVYSPYLYTRSLGTIEYLKLHNEEAMKGSKLKEFKFKQLSEEEKTLFLASSKATLDIQYGTQFGLTQRIQEALVLKRKVITTNENVKEFPEYCEDNFAIITATNFDSVTKEFLNSPFKEYSENLEEKFSLKSFIDNLIIKD